MTNQTFNLDLIPQGVPPIVHVSQYDKGQTWEIHLYENGIVFPVPANTSAAIQGTKPDNTGFQFSAVISAGDNVVTFTLEQQMTVFSGDIDCELVLVNGDDQVATINFILSVEPTTLDDDTVISETQLPLIEQAAELGAVINNYATQIHADAETASTAAAAATSAAESTTADAATATQAADDAQASQTAAASAASNAATSASNAATSEANAEASAAEAARLAATDMTGATASTAGTHGLVPAPAAGDDTKFLGGDGTWKDVPAELSGLTDVVLTNPADGQLLRYNATTQKWDNAGVDSTPTANSSNLVSSGGVKAELDDISSRISNIADYSTSETNTGMTWIDGKQIYRKVVNFGVLPNSGTKTVAHGISNLGTVINLYGHIKSTNAGVTTYLPISVSSPFGVQYCMSTSVDNTNVSIYTGTDRTTHSAVIVIEYTKS
jgi:hypothetical protein